MQHDFDGAISSRWKFEGGKLVRKQVQPLEDHILNFNAELQKNPGALRDLSSMGWVLNIPELHFPRLTKKYPDLGSPDAKIRTAAWRKFIKSSESDPYRVRARRRAPRVT